MKRFDRRVFSMETLHNSQCGSSIKLLKAGGGIFT